MQHWKDPAHPTDSPAYHASTDAMRGGDSVPIESRQRSKEQHTCGEQATRVPDPTSYAVAVARIHQHPRVQDALATPITGRRPAQIQDLPINETLGVAGHHMCQGYRVSSEQFESAEEARDNAKNWTREVRNEIAAGAKDVHDASNRVRNNVKVGQLDLIEPHAERITSFEEGHFVINFRRKSNGTGFEISTFYPVSTENSKEPK